jgi:hypothetical protein
MPTLQELGTKMANTLLRELTVLPTVKFHKSMDDLLDNVPSSGEFFSHQQNHQKIEPTKEALLQDMLKNPKAVVAFCCVSLQMDTRMTFDIDHVFPREKITEKQKLLLDFLNNPSNDALTQAFMGENPQNSELQIHIEKYFKRDFKDNKIKGTRWFFDVCYNNLSNLFHLKHYLNRGKSATTPQEWFEQNFQPKLPNFMKDMNAEGGVNEGIIMQQIFSTRALDSINLGKMKDKYGKEVGSDVIVYLHEGSGIGLGHFIRQWFKANAEVIEISKEIHEINTKLTDMLTEDLRDDGEKEGLEKFLLTINEVLNIATFRETMSRGSTPDSEGGEEERHVVTYDKIKEAFGYMHSVKSMKKQVLPYVVESDRNIVDKNFYRYCRGQKLYTLNYEEISEATELFLITCEQKRSLGITDSDIQSFIQQALEAVDPRKRLEKEMTARKAAEAETAELRRQLAVLAGQHVVAPPQGTLLPAYNASLRDVTKEPASDIPEIGSPYKAKRSRSRSPGSP